jgi:putative endonuclease
MERRLCEHENPDCPGSYTARRLPVILVYCEEFGDVIEAIDREKQIKKWTRKKKEALIEENKEKLINLSKAYRDLNTLN